MNEIVEHLYIYHPIFGPWPLDPNQPEHMIAELVEGHPQFNIFFAKPDEAFWDREDNREV